MSDERTLPHNLEAERSILGAVLLHHEVMRDAEGEIAAEHFYRRAHQVLFRHMAQLSARQTAIDFVTLRESLAAAGDLDEVGGAAYISSLVDGLPRSTNVLEYARIVREKAVLRELIRAASKMIAQAYDADQQAADVLAQAERAIIGLGDRTVTQGFESMQSIASRGLDFLEQAYQRRAPVSGVPSGLKDLDEITRGFQPGTLVTIGARPGIGKSSLLTNIAQHATLEGYKAGMFSLEMSKMDLFVRQVASLARVDTHRLQTGYVADREWGRISQAIGAIAEAPLHIDDTPAVKLAEVRARARRLKAEHGLDLLAIDYLQLMTPATVGKDTLRALQIGEITAGLKSLSKELAAPILIAAQLSRAVETRGGRPKLSDLKESGSIEQDSDIVMFLHRDEDKPDDPTDLIIAKHRGGDIGTVKLTWLKEFTRYESYAYQGRPEDVRLPMGDR